MKMRKTGAVPVPYIIALVLAIIVIALISYWFFVLGGDFGGIITEKACEAKKLAYCSEWKTTGTEPDPGEFTTTCGSITDTNRENYYAPECCRFQWARELNDVACGVA